MIFVSLENFAAESGLQTGNRKNGGFVGFLTWPQQRQAFRVTGVSAKVFRHSYRVTYADCTMGNHVYYARYLDILEAARGEFFRHLGVPLLQLQADDAIFPVVECHLRYKSPARYDDVLAIELWPALVQGARLNFGFRILKEDKSVILEGETFHVCTGLNEKPKRIPEALAAKLQENAGDCPERMLRQ